MIWGVNLAQNNITAAYLETQAIVTAFSSSDITNAGIVLDAIEIGNEPDLYRENGARNSNTFNSTEYVREWVLDDLVASYFYSHDTTLSDGLSSLKTCLH